MRNSKVLIYYTYKQISLLVTDTPRHYPKTASPKKMQSKKKTKIKICKLRQKMKVKKEKASNSKTESHESFYMLIWLMVNVTKPFGINSNVIWYKLETWTLAKLLLLISLFFLIETFLLFLFHLVEDHFSLGNCSMQLFLKYFIMRVVLNI